MLIDVLLLITGLIGLWLAAGLVITSAQKLARALHMSEAFIGLTIISIGTSLPEIFTHIVASINILKGGDAVKLSGIAVGTNIGSNIIQITLILGITALFMKLVGHKKVLKRDYLVMLGSILLLWVFGLNGHISWLEGAILAGGYMIYLFVLAEMEHIHDQRRKGDNLILQGIFTVIGLGALIYSANLVLNSAVVISDAIGIAGTFVGTVIIGFSTALPEFTTAIRGILKGSTDMSLGTLIGSNITNPMLALGIGAMISGYAMDSGLLWFDIPFWFGVSLLGMFFFFHKKVLLKKYAIAMIFFYIVYIGIKVKFFMT